MSRLAWAERARTFTASTHSAADMFPLVAGAGAPTVGIPVGRHLITGEPVRLDPFGWLGCGLTTNTGMFQLGQPGTGKSALVKRQVLGQVCAGVRPVILGDPKGEYSQLVRDLGGQVIRVGPGLDRINPLDAHALPGVTRQDVRARRLSLLLALCAVVRNRAPVTSGEHLVLATAMDQLAGDDATIPELIRVLRQPSPAMLAAAQVRDRDQYERMTQELLWTLSLLTSGALQGVFDGPSTRRMDPGATAMAIDLSAVTDQVLLGAAMLSSWAWGHAAIAADQEAGGRWLVVMDELWRALRGAPGLVDHADALTRLNRSQGVASLMVTHSLQDLQALPDRHEVAKARGFVERSAIVILSGLPRRELRDVAEVVPLTQAERDLVAGWAGAESWRPGRRHPGRGKYLIKTGHRPGVPVRLELSPAEQRLYDTDPDQSLTATDRSGEKR